MTWQLKMKVLVFLRGYVRNLISNLHTVEGRIDAQLRANDVNYYK